LKKYAGMFTKRESELRNNGYFDRIRSAAKNIDGGGKKTKQAKQS